MTWVVRFKGVRPTPRDDGVLWTHARIQEATDNLGEPGAFTDVETFPITTYPDPTNPPTLNITTDSANLLPGWYRVRFNDAGSGIEFTAPRYFSSVGFRPSTRQVAIHIKNRTVDENNNYIGDFTATTAVTKDEVEELIVKAEQRVLRKLDTDPNVPIPSESHQGVSELVALYAAMLVELTKFGEQIQANRSPYIHLRDLFNEQFPEVVTDVTGESPPVSGSGSLSVWDLVATQDNTPQWGFPDPETVNWDSKF